MGLANEEAGANSRINNKWSLAQFLLTLTLQTGKTRTTNTPAKCGLHKADPVPGVFPAKLTGTGWISRRGKRPNILVSSFLACGVYTGTANEEAKI